MVFYPAIKPPFLNNPSSQYGDSGYPKVDTAEIRIADVVVSMTRQCNLRVPAEFSAFIPRAEVHRRYQNGQLSEEDIILSGITLVHAPRHRATGGSRDNGEKWGDRLVTKEASTVVPEGGSKAKAGVPLAANAKEENNFSRRKTVLDQTSPPQINFISRKNTPA